MELTLHNIETRIYTLRGLQVMLDSDLADMYQTETKYVNRAVTRNESRFPEPFAFRLTSQEWEFLKCQLGTSSSTHGGRRTLPIAFTEQGVAMLSAVLNTEVAIQVSIRIMQAFVAMRKTLGQLDGVIRRLEGVEQKQWLTDTRLDGVLKALETETKPRQGVFFAGQLFDAQVFASDLVKQATKSLVLVDNYVDERTLMLLSKRKQGVTCRVHTRIHAALQKDLEKHNRQYPAIGLVENRGSHDWFFIIDQSELYHIGASLKDLGNQCFAFSRMDEWLGEVQAKLLTP
jgi:hypothetical protein